MNFDDAPAEAAFRAEARAWLKENGSKFIPDSPPGTPGYYAIARKWQAAKAKAGYVGFLLPKELGGRGGMPIELQIFFQEQANHPLHESEHYFTLGQNQIPTALMTHDREDIARRLIPPTLHGDIIWCQLWSEPSGGSDMGGIRTAAKRDGDHWVVNGQKIWSSHAHNADWGLLLTRTDPGVPKHKGLTVFVIDMKNTPGVEIRPIKQISGRSEFNEVFFTDMRVPDAWRVGGVGEGWQVALTVMMTERFTLLGDPGTAADLLDEMFDLGDRDNGFGDRLLDHDNFRATFADYYATITAMRYFHARLLTSFSRGVVPGPEATIGKMTTARWAQAMAAATMDALGPLGVTNDPKAEPTLAYLQEVYFRAVGWRMGGGTDEISKNIIAERVLGMPSELRVDKDVPFSKVRSG